MSPALALMLTLLPRYELRLDSQIDILVVRKRLDGTDEQIGCLCHTRRLWGES